MDGGMSRVRSMQVERVHLTSGVQRGATGVEHAGRQRVLVLTSFKPRCRVDPSVQVAHRGGVPLSGRIIPNTGGSRHGGDDMSGCN